MSQGTKEVWSGLMKLSGMYMFGLAQSHSQVETQSDSAYNMAIIPEQDLDRQSSD
jgi:hypothetical protein